MNYDEAREFVRGGWRWSTMNDGVIRTAPPCIRFAGAIVGSRSATVIDTTGTEKRARAFLRSTQATDKLVRKDLCRLWRGSQLGVRKLEECLSGSSGPTSIL